MQLQKNTDRKYVGNSNLLTAIDALRGALGDNPCVLLEAPGGEYFRHYFSDPELEEAIKDVTPHLPDTLLQKSEVFRILVHHLESVLKYAEIQTCTHEETHRGGAIWEICDSCGRKWADDEGGKPDDAHDYPQVLTDAMIFLSSLEPIQSDPEPGTEKPFNRKNSVESNTLLSAWRKYTKNLESNDPCEHFKAGWNAANSNKS